MKVGDMVRIARYDDQVSETGMIINHWMSEGDFDIWTVFVNGTGERRSYITKELRIVSASR